MRFLLCDDHALFRSGLELVLSDLADDGESIDLVGVGNAEAAFAAVEQDSDFDLALVDLQLPGMSGFGAIDVFRRDHPELPIVVISASEEPADARLALDKGAMGFIPKSTEASVLLAALKLVLSGGVYVPPMMVGTEATAGAPSADPELPVLSPRQREVLDLIAMGRTNAEIGTALGIAPGTVKSHIVRLFEVLGVANRTEAAMRLEEIKKAQR